MNAAHIIAQSPPSYRPADRIPILLGMAYTLKISAHWLTLSALGRESVTRGDELLRWWGRKIFASGNGGLSVSGRHHFEPGQPYVVMSNHRSLVDIPALFLATPGSLRMVFKQELTRVPIWGRALVASGFVPVNRGSRGKAIAQLEEAKKSLARGICIWIAPEGTRSRDGELGAFKKGGFHLAQQLGVPIIPTWIEGTEKMVPADSLRASYDQQASVTFGEPIETRGRGPGQIDGLMDEVRRAMLSMGSG
jgi:1-acyl-sn-glycerol-3-phosphate acyltransferase